MKLRIALTIALSAVVVPVLVPSPAQATSPPPPSAVAVFAKTSEWSTGYVGTLTVHNKTSVPITRWRLDFTLAAGTSVTSSWNGLLSRSGDRYVVTNESWNGTLAPGAKATFGYVAEGQAVPADCTINGAPCSGYPPPPADTTAPTRPGALTIDLSKGVVLRWGASVDTTPVRYEIWEDGRLRTVVTGTEYVYATDGVLPPKIYVFSVRAVDVAGNISASVYNTVGRIWRGDEVPAAPAAVSSTPLSPIATRVAWAPVETGSPFTPPPTAGYRVTVDGQVAGDVGLPSIILHLSPGPHTIAVQTINAVDQLSAPVEITVAA